MKEFPLIKLVVLFICGIVLESIIQAGLLILLFFSFTFIFIALILFFFLHNSLRSLLINISIAITLTSLGAACLSNYKEN